MYWLMPFSLNIAQYQCKRVDRTMLLHTSNEVAYINNTLTNTLLVECLKSRVTWLPGHEENRLDGFVQMVKHA